MTETLTYNPAEANPPVLSSDEQNSLEVAERLGQEEADLYAGKFENAEELENAYLELQRKLGSGEDEDSEEAYLDEDDEYYDEATSAGIELIQGAQELFPNIKNYKSFRTWSGVRPLVKPKNINKNLPIPRSHLVIDHKKSGLDNFLTVCGGALTTHRLMAEDAVNKLGNKFGINISCSSHITSLLN